MALSRLGVANTVDSGAADTCTVTRPSGTTAGALIVATIACAEQALTSITAPDNTWTQVVPLFLSLTGGGQALAVFIYTATASDPSTWTFNLNGGTTANKAWDTAVVSIGSTAATGVASFDASATLEDIDATVTTASITPSVANCLVYSVMTSDEVGGAAPSWTPTTPASSGNALAELADAVASSDMGTCMNEETQTTATATTHTSVKTGARGAATVIFSVKETTNSRVQVLRPSNPNVGPMALRHLMKRRWRTTYSPPTGGVVQILSGGANLLFTEAVTLVKTAILGPATNIVFSDSATLVKIARIAESDNITFTEAITLVKTAILAPSDTLTFTEAVTLVASRVLIPSTNITFAEAVTLVATKVVAPVSNITFVVTTNLVRVASSAVARISGIVPAIMSLLDKWK